MDASDEQYLTADAEDRRAALEQAVTLFDSALDAHKMSNPVLFTAEAFYMWLRARPSIQPVRLVLRHGPVETQPGYEDAP